MFPIPAYCIYGLYTFSLDNLKKSSSYHVLVQCICVKLTYLFFQVNLHRSCPFWPDDGMCALKDCSVEECSEVRT